MSPESVLDGVYTAESDAWMFGVLLWGMCLPSLCGLIVFVSVVCDSAIRDSFVCGDTVAAYR